MGVRWGQGSVASAAFRGGVSVKWAGTSAAEGRDCGFPMILYTPPLSHTYIRSNPPHPGEEGGRRLSFTCSDLIPLKWFSTKDGLVRPTWLAPPPHTTHASHTHTHCSVQAEGFLKEQVAQNSMTVLKPRPQDIAPPLDQEWRVRNTPASFFQALDV